MGEFLEYIKINFPKHEVYEFCEYLIIFFSTRLNLYLLGKDDEYDLTYLKDASKNLQVKGIIKSLKIEGREVMRIIDAKSDSKKISC